MVSAFGKIHTHTYTTVVLRIYQGIYLDNRQLGIRTEKLTSCREREFSLLLRAALLEKTAVECVLLFFAIIHQFTAAPEQVTLN